jgi:hypothetical protein
MMPDGNKVTIFVPVFCDCGHPIAGAPVRVRILSATHDATDSGEVEYTLYGTTDDAGLYYTSFDHGSGELPDLTGGEVQVIACDGTVDYAKLEAVGKLNPTAAVDLAEAAYGLITSDLELDDAEALYGQADSLSRITSEIFLRWFLTPYELSPVACHGGECDEAKTEHVVGRLLLDSGAARVTCTDEIETDMVPGLGDTRDFTYVLENTGKERIADFKLCFGSGGGAAAQKVLAEKLDAVLARDVTVPDRWTARREGSCLVFESDDLYSIGPGKSGTFMIKTDEDTPTGRARASASTLDDKGNHVDLSNEDPVEIPGPQFVSTDVPEEVAFVEKALVIDGSELLDRTATFDRSDLVERTATLDRQDLELVRPELQDAGLLRPELGSVPLDGVVKNIDPAGSELVAPTRTLADGPTLEGSAELLRRTEEEE